MRGSPLEQEKTKNIRGKAVTKAILLLVLAGLSIALAELSPLNAYLRPDRFQEIVRQAGPMGPAFLLVSCAVCTCFFVPGTIFVAVGAVLFGPWLSFACALPGALVASAVSFLVARRLGRDFVASLLGDRLKCYDESICRNGFRTVLFLRLAFMPFAPMNYCMGLTKVLFRDYFFATAIGEAATILVIAFFFGELRDTWMSRDWSRLISARVLLAFGFIIALAVLARLFQKKLERCFPGSNSERLVSEEHVEGDTSN